MATPTKTLVFKPKSPKDVAAVVVVAAKTTKTSLGAVAKAAGVKEPRLAKEDLVKSLFGVSPAEINACHVEKKDKVVILVDSLVSGEELFECGAETKSGETLKLLADVVVDFSEVPEEKPKEKQQPKKKEEKSVEKESEAKLIGITADKTRDFSAWYSQIVVKGEMLDYYDVSGCYILRPNSYFVWQEIQNWFNDRIRKMGVKNSYFPMFVSNRVLQKEKDHVEGFAPEVAWVTRAGNLELDEHIAIRPTSETVMYPYYAKWIRLHRDLPLRLNQWNSVVRWEFKHPQPFLRTREFLWQEGHTAHLTKQGAAEEVEQILTLYRTIYEELLAVPVVRGRKTENEKFAGADYTTTVEGFVAATGRGIQGATSHHLGQNFSKMFNIAVENPDGDDKIFAFQNLWGLSTRVIGVMVMTHSDNKGLVLPPRVAQNQVVVMPVGLTAKTLAEEKKAITAGAEAIEKALLDADVRVVGDYRDNYSPGWKYADWELKGVPVRLEYGPKDHAKGQVMAVRRDTGAKSTFKVEEVALGVAELLETIQKELLDKARAEFDAHRVLVHEWADFVPTLNAKNVIVAPWCGVPECEDDIKDSLAKKDDGEEEEDERAPLMGAKSLCIPDEQPPLKEGQKCVRCDQPAKMYCMFGRSY